MEELILGCEKFLSKEYSIEEFSGFLSRIAVPSNKITFVKEAENKIEYIRFMVSSEHRYNECVKVINGLLENLNLDS